MATFPHSLCGIRFGDHGEQHGAVVARSEFERGLPRQRRTAADSLVAVPCTLLFNSLANAQAWESWFYGEALAGSGLFSFTLPRNGQVVQAQVRGGDIGTLKPRSPDWQWSERTLVLEYVRQGFTVLAPGSYDVAANRVMSVQRASEATYRDAAGLLQTAAANVARFQHAEFATNLAFYSQDLSNAAWGKNSLTVTGGLTIGGQSGVFLLQGGATGSNEFLSQPIRLVTGELATTTWRIHQGTAAQNIFMRRTSADTSSWGLVWSGGVPSPVAVPAGTTVLIEAVGNGWFDVSTTRLLTEDSQGCRLYADSTNLGGTVYVQHVQFEQGGVKHTHVPTLGVAATAGVGAARLLVEPAATNLLPNSNDFAAATWTKSVLDLTPGVAGPFPGLLATTITATAANGLIQRAPTVVAGQALAGSIWIRRRTGTGNVSMRVGGGGGGVLSLTATWQRLERTEVPADTTGRFGISINIAGDEVDIAGAQLEVGTVATSHIPTLPASGATRAADLITVVA